MVTPSVSASGGPADTDPVVTLTAPSGAAFPTAPTPAGWSCALSVADTVLTCTSTATTPIPAGTDLGAISAGVGFSTTPGAQTTSVTLADTPDGATSVTKSTTTTEQERSDSGPGRDRLGTGDGHHRLDGHRRGHALGVRHRRARPTPTPWSP